MPEFVRGIELNRCFYHEAVRPILDACFPGLAHSAALLGPGSDVLGFDDEMSTDHDWGPRLLLFLGADDHARLGVSLRYTLSGRIPLLFRGFPTRSLNNGDGTLRFSAEGSAAADHGVQTKTIAGFVREQLGVDLSEPVEPAQWLTFTGQDLLGVTAGAVYHDGLGLQAVRDAFAYYPHDVWLYLLAAGWARIGQEEHLMGRAGYAGDELGSALISSRLVRDLMRLCFLLEKQYPPYPKWFGTAFAGLACAAELTRPLRLAQVAEAWQEREAALVVAYERVAAMQAALGLTAPLPTKVAAFHGRRFAVIHQGCGYAQALLDQIQDAELRRIAQRRPIGSIEQYSDSTDLLSDKCWRPTLRGLYAAPDGT